MKKTNNTHSLATALLISYSFVEGVNASTITLISENDISTNRSFGSLDREYGESWTDSRINPVSTTDNTVSFTHQMQFYSGLYVPEDGDDFALSNVSRVEYFLFFTVLDSRNLGYDLSLDSFARGYGTSHLEGGSGMDHFPGAFYIEVDTDMSNGGGSRDIIKQGAWPSQAGARLTSSTSYANNLGEHAPTLNLGSYSGTRSFGIYFRLRPNLIFQNETHGQSSFRFGLTNSDPALDDSGLAQPGDLYGEDALGHFATVNARFHSDIPEPSSSLLISVALFCTLAFRKR